MGYRSRLHVLIAAAALSAGLPRPAAARALLTQKQALAIAFPNGETVERRTAYLSAEQQKTAQENGHVKIDSKVWTYYVGRSSSGVVGYAYFESHVVRTMPETFMVVINGDDTIRFVELLAFLEPDDYLPNQRWLAQFKRKALKDDLMVHRGVRNISGASLTSQALSDGVRRVLAVHAVIRAEAKAAAYPLETSPALLLE